MCAADHETASWLFGFELARRSCISTPEQLPASTTNHQPNLAGT